MYEVYLLLLKVYRDVFGVIMSLRVCVWAL